VHLSSRTAGKAQESQVDLTERTNRAMAQAGETGTGTKEATCARVARGWVQLLKSKLSPATGCCLTIIVCCVYFTVFSFSLFFYLPIRYPINPLVPFPHQCFFLCNHNVQ
jgi:hypothetical protein